MSETRVAELAEIVAGLRGAGVTTVQVSWNGAGDEGAIDETLPYNGDEFVSDLPNDLLQRIEELVNDLLYDRFDSWGEGDGGSGVGVIDVATGTVTLNHSVMVLTEAPAVTVTVGAA